LFGFVAAITFCVGCKNHAISRAPGPGDFTEDDVQQFVTVGRPISEIISRYGKPEFARTNGVYGRYDFNSGLPETRPGHGYIFGGFSVRTKDGKAVDWHVTRWEKID